MKNVRNITKNFNNSKNLIYEKKTLSNNVSLHFHNFYELEFIVEGGGVTYFNGKSYEIKKGMVIFLTPKDFHSYELTKNTTFINVQFTFDAISKTCMKKLQKLCNF